MERKTLRGWIRTDGLLHLETSALITVAVAKFAPLWVAVIAALLIGIGKELYDKKHEGVASWHDVICDIAGVAIGAAICIL